MFEDLEVYYQVMEVFSVGVKAVRNTWHHLYVCVFSWKIAIIMWSALITVELIEYSLIFAPLPSE